jgi:cobalt-zinc-cadmium efflux system outer membrane protein
MVGVVVLPRARCAALELETAIALARASAPAVQAAEARVAAARAHWYQSGRWRNPELELRGENWRVRPDLHATNPPLDFFATLTQLFELGGKRAKRQAVAMAERERAHEQARLVERDVSVQAATWFLTVVRAHAELDAVENAASDLGRLRDIAARRVEQGRAPAAELLKLQAEEARLGTAAVELKTQESTALNALRQLLAKPDLRAEELSMPRVVVPPEDADRDLVEKLLQQHPEYRAATAEKERALRALELEQARRIPDPALTAGYKRTEDRDTLVAGVVLPIPVFDTNWGNVQRAVAELSAASAEAEATVLRLRAELFGLLARWRSLAARAERMEQDLLAPAAGVRHAARVAFEEGTGEIVALVDAERVYLEARRTAIGTRAEAVAAATAWRIFSGETTAP